MKLEKNDWDKLLSDTKIYIIGAQSRAKTLTGYLRALYPETSVAAYLVDDAEKNEPEIEGSPVLRLEKENVYHTEYPVFIATKGIYHEKFQKGLREIGFGKIIPVTAEIDNYFRNAYVKQKFRYDGREFRRLDQQNITCAEAAFSACIYMAESVYDKPLQGSYVCPEYERPIQVGAALTDKRLAPDILTDCEGEHISEKNRQYCELTALYWMWKHAGEDIIGLAHYRRHFILPDHWLERMESNSIDVVLPVPTCVFPNIDENYRERHDPSDWDYLLEYLQREFPEDYEVGIRVFKDNLYSPCNMFIMRKPVLDDLCAWMFPILDEVVAHGGIKADTYLNRYPGFLSERLMTLYFEKHKRDYRIVYADKMFLS